MTIDFDAQCHLADLRMRVQRGDRVTAAEYRDLLLDLRRGRDMAAAATRSATAKAAKQKRADASAKAKPKLDLSKLFGSADSPSQPATPRGSPCTLLKAAL